VGDRAALDRLDGLRETRDDPIGPFPSDIGRRRVSRTKVDLTPGEIEALARAAFGASTRVAACQPAEQGLYNAAYLLDLAGAGPPRAFLKVAPPDDVPVLTYEKDLLRTEIAVLKALAAAKIAAPVPAVLADDLSRRIVDRDLVFMQALEGRSLSALRPTLGAADLVGLRHQIGAIAASFAAVTAPTFGYPGHPDLQAPTWREAWRRIVGALLADARRFDSPLPAPLGEIADLFEAALPEFEDVITPRLIHYDLWDGNILVRPGAKGWEVTGVVDWERAFYGDPLAEIVSLVLFEDSAQKAAVLDALAAAGGAAQTDGEAARRLTLYRAYLWLIMIVEAGPRGAAGSILLPTSWAARRLMRDLTAAAREA